MKEKFENYGKTRGSTKMRKKLISFITVLSMITALLPVFELPAFAEGEITEISTLAEFEAFRDSVNNGTDYSGKTVKLTDDIVMNPADKYHSTGSIINEADMDNWTPIGDAAHKFSGTFDGQNYTIRNLYINDSTNDTVGLFGYNEGTIKNIHLVSPAITSTKDNAVIGGICGYSSGTIQGCSIAKTTIYEPTNVNAAGTGSIAGGICGENHGTVKWCDHSAVASSMNIAGGICGKSIDGTITECYVSDSGSAIASEVTTGEEYPKVITGGICGYLEGGTVSNCYNAGGAAAINAKAGSTVGGIVGKVYVSKNMTITDCYTFSRQQGGDVSNYFGYIVGHILIPEEHGTVDNVKVVKNYFNKTYNGYPIGETEGDSYPNYIVQYDDAVAAEYRTSHFAVQSNFVDWNFDDTWVMSQKLGRPILRNNPEPQINTAEVRYQIDGGAWQESSLFDAIWAGYGAASTLVIELTKDITLSDSNWLYSPAIGRTGVKWIIDGQGNKITRGSSVIDTLFPISTEGSDITFKNITIDGGAVWSSDDLATRKNNGIELNSNAHLIYVTNGSTVTLDSGAVLQNNHLTSESGAAVYVGYANADSETGTLIMKDGAKILNNESNNAGGAVFVNWHCTFTMDGGEISGNYAPNDGGAIDNEGTFTINNGKISANATSEAGTYGGGGIDNSGTVIMNGGEISQNRSHLGGGVLSTGNFTMNGGEIKENSAYRGGGAYVSGGQKFTMSNAKIHKNTVSDHDGHTGHGGGLFIINNENVLLSGTAQIIDNTYNGNADNVFLPQIGHYKKITVSAPLTEGAFIGVNTSTAPTDEAPVDITGTNGEDYSKYFHSDKDEYKIVNGADNVVQLVVKPPHSHDMSVECGDTSAVSFTKALTSQDNKLYIDGVEIALTDDVLELPEGNYYLKDNVTINSPIRVGSVVNLCLNGKTLDMGDKNIDITKTTGSLSLCDCVGGGVITSAYANGERSSGLINCHNEFSMYGGKVINTADADHAYYYMRAVCAYGGAVKLYGGEIVSENDDAVYYDENEGSALTLSGSPKITGAADYADIYTHNAFTQRVITIEAPLNITEPYRIEAINPYLLTSGWAANMSDKVIANYFVSAAESLIIQKNSNGELEFARAHSHDMSLECGNENAIAFNKALTSKNGELYVDGVKARETYENGEVYLLTKGNYYLTENLTLNKGVIFRTNYGETVNICLNGKTIQLDGNNNISNNEQLNICSCAPGGTIKGNCSGYNGSDAVIYNRRDLSVYGVKIENTAASAPDEHQYAINSSEYLKLCGCEVISQNDTAIDISYLYGDMYLSGANKIKGAADKSDIDLNNVSQDIDDCKIIIDGTLTTTLPYRISAASAKVFTEGWNTNMSDKDFNNYFISADKERFVNKNDQGELELCNYMITEQPSAGNKYTVTANGEPNSYQWHMAQTTTDEVTTENANTCESYTEYTPENGWTCCDNNYDYTAAYFIIDLKQGDILTVNPTEAEDATKKIENMYIVSSEGDKMEVEINEEGKFVFRVAHSGTYTLFAYHDYSGNYYAGSTVKATLTRVDLGGAVSDQIANKFTGTEDGTYACVIGYENGHKITSDVIDYTAPVVKPTGTPVVEPTGTPSVNPTSTPSVNPTGTPTAAPTTKPATVVKPGEKVEIGDTTVENKEDGTVIIGGEDKTDVTVELPEGGGDKVTVDEDGKVNVPEGSKVNTGEEGITITLHQGGEVDKEGNVSGEEVTVGDTTITAPENDKITTDKDGKTGVKPGVTVENTDTKIIIDTGSGTVDKDGIITFPEGGKVTVEKDGQTTTIEVPSGGTVNTGSLPTPKPTTKPRNGGGGSSSYTVTFKANNGDKNTNVTVAKNTAVSEPTAPTKEGYTFDGWYTDSKLEAKYDFSKEVTRSFTLYAKWTETAEPTKEPVSSTEQHKAYIVGYENKFNPDGNITRAEVAAILARLTDGFDENGSYTTDFPDVAKGLWYYNYIGFEADKDVIVGYPDGTFKPEDSITRAEFAALISKFTGITTAEHIDVPFTDTDGHWAAKQIEECYRAGYIEGYMDNTFLPDNHITRAEAVAIINRVLDRSDIKDFENPFTDVKENHWAYADIMEAAVTHDVN